VHDRVRTPRGILVLAAVALAAEWMGHSLTWWLTGGADAGHALSGSMHGYLQPLGVTLACAALVGAWLVARTLDGLGRRAAGLRRALRAAWRRPDLASTSRPDPAAAPVRPEPAAELVGLAALLWVVQVSVYLIQENLEARAVGLAWPGLRVLSAHHGSALVIHAAVALAVAGLVVVLARSWARRQATVTRLGSLLAVLVAARGRSGDRHGRPAQPWTPVAPLAAALAPRPPPAGLLT
jgi:hypothetical protein